MDMTYEDMLREMEAYQAAHTPVFTEEKRLTEHEAMLERLCGKNAEDDALLAALRKLFTAEEAETWLLCPAFSKTEAPLPQEALFEMARPELRSRLPAITNKLLDRKVLLQVKKAEQQGYFARCDEHCIRTLHNLAESRRPKSVGGLVKVVANRCVGCKLCAKVCPVNAVMVLGKIVVIDDTVCMGCAACVKKCPKEALTV